MAHNPLSIQPGVPNVTVGTTQSPSAPAQATEVTPAPKVVHKEGESAYSAAPAEPKVSLRGGTYPNGLDPVEFAKLSEVAKTEKVSALRDRQNQLGEEIVQRLEKLKSRWNGLSPSTQAKALRKFHDKSKRIDPIAKNELNRKLQRAEDAERKVAVLQSEADELEKPAKVKVNSRPRETVQSELKAAQSEQAQMVQEATGLVEEKNVMSDMLATSEDIIDSSGAAGSSLLDKIAEFLNIDWFFLATGISKNPIQVDFQNQVDRRSEHLDRMAALKLEKARFDEQVMREKHAGLMKEGLGAERQQVSLVKQAENKDDSAAALARAALSQ